MAYILRRARNDDETEPLFSNRVRTRHRLKVL